MSDVIFIPGRMGIQTDEQEIPPSHGLRRGRSIPTEDRLYRPGDAARYAWVNPILIRVHSCPFAVNSLDTSANAELFPIAAQAPADRLT
jgi:hypothetical protein